MNNQDILDIVNPYNQNVIGHVALTNWDTINDYLENASKLFKNRKNWLPAYKRIEILQKTIELMKNQFNELAYGIANEGGKPLIDARIEVTRAIDGVGWCIKELSHLTGKEIPMGLTEASINRIAFTTREPIGPVVAISAFNHPLNLIVHQVAPAIAVGCPVLVKPAGVTPLSCQKFISFLYESGLPEGWCRFVPCKPQLAEKMVCDKRVAFVSFIGSAQVGWMLKSKLAPGTRCSLEHGGVAPVIIDHTAEINTIIPPLLKGGFYHSGQVCVSVQRIFAPHAQAEEIAAALAKGAEQLVVGNAIEETTQCGPLIRPQEVTRVASWIDEAKQAGAHIITGGTKLSDTTYAPTVLFNPPATAKITRMEVFGPAICVYSYDTIDEAFIRANSLDYAFQAAIFTKQLDTAMQAIQALDATAVMINDHTAFRVDWMPFAGRKHSGYGTGGIGYTMHDMTQDKMAIIKL